MGVLDTFPIAWRQTAGAPMLLPSAPAAPSAAPAAAPAKPQPQTAAPATGEPKKPEAASPLDAVASDLERSGADYRRAVGEINAHTMSLKPPELPQLPPKPKQVQTSPMEAWGSAAMIFAALAPMFSRNHATAAMNAAAAALNGIYGKDKEQTEYNFKVWEQETSNAITMANFQHRAYEEMIGKDRMSLDAITGMHESQRDEIKAKMETVARAFNDPEMVQAGNRAGLTGMVELQQKRNDAAKQMEVQKLEAGRYGMQYMAFQSLQNDPEYVAAKQRGDTIATSSMEAEAMKPFAYLGGARGAAGAARVQPWPQDEADAKVERIANLQEPFLSSSLTAVNKDGPNSAEGINARALERMKQQRKGATEGDYAAFQKQKLELNSNTKAAQTVRSFEVLTQHLNTLENDVIALPDRKNEKLYNEALIAAARQIGNVPVSDFESAKEIISTELLKAVSGTGATLAESDRKELKDALDVAKTNAQLLSVIHHWKELAGAQVSAVAREYSQYKPVQEYTALSEDRMRKMFINPETHEVDDKLLKEDLARIHSLTEQEKKGGRIFGGKSAPAPAAPAPAASAAAPKEKETQIVAKKQLNGTWYVKKSDGQWYLAIEAK